MANLKNFHKERLPEFRELFSALFKIKDKDIQKRVIDAINGVCNHKHNTRDSSTQTDFNQQDQASITKIEFKSNESLRYEDKKIRKRRVKNKVPRVEKYDASKDTNEKMLKVLKPSAPKKKKLENFANLLDDYDLCELNQVEDQWFRTVTKDEITKDDIIQQMLKEYEVSEQYIGGFYPIHHAIIENNKKKLQRQFYVFREKNKNINELLTENHETPIQLALKSNSFCSIIKLLLEEKPDIYQIDKDGNTLIHLAMLYTDDKDILSILLNKIELKFLLKLNDDGLSALHIGVIHNKFLMCKVLIEFINVKCGIRNIAMNIDDEKKLNEIYIEIINNMSSKEPEELNYDKYEIINQKDLKHYRTALFFALVNNRKSKSLINLLLVNYADPSLEDRSSIDCITTAREIVEKTGVNELLSCLLNSSSYISKCLTI